MKDINSKNQAKTIKSFSLIIILLLLTFLVANNNYVLFHILTEFAIVILRYSMIVMALFIYNTSENYYITFIAIVFGILGTFDLLNLLILKQIAVFEISSTNCLIQLKILEKYIVAISFVVSFNYINNKVNIKNLIYSYISIVGIGIIITCCSEIFPVCYIDGNGETLFKQISEYVILFVTIWTGCLFYKNRNSSIFKQDKSLVAAIVLIMIYQLPFIIFTNSNIFLRFIGQILKLLSFLCLYGVTVKTIFSLANSGMFKKLKNKLYEQESINTRVNIKNQELIQISKNMKDMISKYEKILEAFPYAIIIRDGKKIVYVNNRSGNLFNDKSGDDLVGKDILTVVNNDFKEIAKQRISMKDKRTLLEDKNLIKLDKGANEIEIQGVFIEFNGKEYCMEIARNITEKKTTNLIQEKLEESIEIDRQRTEFFANLSHELRTPINVIYSALQLEDMYIKDNSMNNIEKYNKVVKQNCLRLLRMINNLIDITKIDAGFLKPLFEKHNIIEIVENIVLSVVTYVEVNKMHITFDTEIEEAYVNCDPDLIERIMLNLLSNAVKYGKENGEIFVKICKINKSIIAIRIKDDGIGIPEDKQEAIFKRFVQVDKAFTRNCQGSGIGLSLVDSLIKLHNGTISLKSAENLGSEFTIQLPFSEINEKMCEESEKFTENKNVIEKVNIEFSDIYN